MIMLVSKIPVFYIHQFLDHPDTASHGIELFYRDADKREDSCTALLLAQAYMQSLAHLATITCWVRLVAHHLCNNMAGSCMRGNRM